jgi:hypothetical protein
VPGCEGGDCLCDVGYCRPRPCSASGECGAGLACVGGACAPAPAADAAAACRIEPRLATVKPGSAVALSVRAVRADGSALPYAGPVAFASDATDVAAVDAAGRITGGTGAGRARVTATVGGAACAAEVRNLGDPGGGLRVAVIDERTGAAVSGATVVVDGGAGPGDTDGDGVVRFAVPVGLPRTVSVFHADYAYLTVVSVAGSDLLLRVRRDGAGMAGGIKGRFVPDGFFDGSELHAGIAGTSLPESLVDLSVESLLGPLVPRELTLGDTYRTDLPQGVTLGVGAEWFIDDPDRPGTKGPFFAAPGVPSSCDDEARTAAGTCGTRAGWGLAGNIPLQTLLDELPGGLSGGVSPGVLLAALLPELSRFRSAVLPDVRFDLAPTVCPDADGDGAPDATCAAAARGPDPRALTPVSLAATRPLALRVELALPALPAHAGVPVGGVLAVGAALVPGRGLVPLGLAASLDGADGSAPDGALDGPFFLRLAPLHDGLEASPYLAAALAVDLDRLEGRATCTAADRSGCTALSGLVRRAEALPYGGTVSFDGPFLGFADDARFDVPTRTFAPGSGVAGAALGRLAFRTDAGREWQVWLAGPGPARLPLPPPGFADRLLDADGGRASLSAQALRVDASLETLVGYGPVHSGNLAGFTKAFSSVTIPR